MNKGVDHLPVSYTLPSIDGPAPSGPTCHRAFRNVWPRNVQYGSFLCESCGFVPTKTKRSAMYTEEEKRVGPTVEKKKVQRLCPFGLAGKGQMPQSIQELLCK